MQDARLEPKQERIDKSEGKEETALFSFVGIFMETILDRKRQA